MKYSVKMKNLRLTSFLLCALILLLSCPITTVADDTVSANTSANQPEQTQTTTQSPLAGATLPEEVLGPGELFYEDLQALRIEDVARPETVTLEMAQEAQHVNRLWEQENNLHTVIFQNRGGNKTAYVYGKPVKYVTAEGAVRDKDTAITETGLAGFAYAMTDNSITAYFSSNASGGVAVEFAGHSMRMIPEGSNLVSVAARGEGDNEILYNNAFGARTVLRYQTQLNGVKEDIVLLQNVGKYSFRFLLTTAMTPVEQNGAWVLTDEAGEVVMTLGEIIVKDSAGKTAYGDLNITPRAQGGYLMTVTAPEAFLTAPDTVYPVYIDPTTTVDEIGYYETYEGPSTIYNEYDAIVDVGLYNSETEYQAAIADTDYHRLSANGRIIYKLPDFYADYGLFTEMDAKQIGKVMLYVPFASGTYRYVTTAMPTATWSGEDTPTALYDTALWDAKTVAFTNTASVSASAGMCSLNITQIARSWLGYNANGAGVTFNPQYGFALCNTVSTVRNVMATEASAELGDAYYTVDYDYTGGLYYVRNTAALKYLAKSDATTLTVIDDVNAVSAWTLDYQGNGKHIVYCGSDDSYLLQASGRLVATTTIDSIYLWTIASARTGGVTFTNSFNDKVLCYNGTAVTTVTARAHTDSTYTQTTWAIIPIVTLQSFTVSNTEWIDVNPNATSPTLLSVTPYNAALSDSSCFTGESGNTAIATIDAAGNVTGVGNGYTTITVTHKITGKSEEFPISVGQTIPNGAYQFKNRYSDTYAVRASDAASAPLLDGGERENPSTYWIFTYVGNGYYNIRSSYNQLYLRPNSLAAGNSIFQTTGNSNNCKWRIILAPSGYFKIGAYTTATSNHNQLALSYDTEGGALKLVTHYSRTELPMQAEWRPFRATALVNYYDDSFDSDYDYAENFILANEFVNLVYMRTFGLRYAMVGAPQSCDAVSTLNSCIYGPDVPCSTLCTSFCDIHHKNIIKISDELYSNIGENEVRILWTDQSSENFCFSASGEHVCLQMHVLGGVYAKRPVIQIFEPEYNPYDSIDDEFERTVCASLVLAHEIAHTLGLDEQYTNSEHDAEDDYICIMERYDPRYAISFYNSIVAENSTVKPFCNSCITQLRELIAASNLE